jgi:hypothetical protein
VPKRFIGSRRFVWFVWLEEIGAIDQRNKPNELNKRDQP